MYVDKNVYTDTKGKTYARYLLRESKRQGKKTIKTTILNITDWGEQTCEALRFVLGNKKRLGELERTAWSPYLLRNSNATMVELEHGLDAAQAQLGHTSANTTRRYSKAQLRIRETLAHNRRNPFEPEPDAS